MLKSDEVVVSVAFLLFPLFTASVSLNLGPLQVVLLKQRRLLQAENLSLEGLVTMKARRLSLVAEENRRLRALLRERKCRFPSVCCVNRAFIAMIL